MVSLVIIFCSLKIAGDFIFLITYESIIPMLNVSWVLIESNQRNIQLTYLELNFIKMFNHYTLNSYFFHIKLAQQFRRLWKNTASSIFFGRIPCISANPNRAGSTIPCPKNKGLKIGLFFLVRLESSSSSVHKTDRSIHRTVQTCSR